jgi:hypothetical protein
MSKVAVLGCGPAGLLCALAVEDCGHDVTILSNNVKSNIPGSVYLHEAVPGVTGVYPDNHVQYVRMGTPEGYARKVYGDAARNTGWPNFLAVYPSWNARKAYNKLWIRFGPQVQHWQYNHRTFFAIIARYDYVISTLPAHSICINNAHRFDGEEYWIKTLPTPPMDERHDIVVYNGLATDLWYRWSVLGGTCSIESTFDIWPDDMNVIKGI